MGNVDNDSTKTNMFDPPIVAQYIRIVPVVCRKACTLRLELVGCELNGKQTDRNTVVEFNPSLWFCLPISFLRFPSRPDTKRTGDESGSHTRLQALNIDVVM